MQWTPLHVLSQYSILDSTASVTALAEKARFHSISALALTDQGNLHGAVDFCKACKEVGVKPILGCKIWMAPRSRKEKRREFGTPNGFPILLLAKDRIGYRNLCKLSSIGFLEGFYYQPRIDKEVLALHREGLICLPCNSHGPISFRILQGEEEALQQEVSWYRELFGEDFYFEMRRATPVEETAISESWLLQKMRTAWENQQKVNERLLSLSQQYKIPIAATHEIHYIEKEDWQAHEVLLNIQSGEPIEIWERDSRGNPKGRIPNPKRDTAAFRDLYFKSSEEMKQLFADLPQALEETVRIAAKCECEIDLKAKHYPIFVPPHLEGKRFTKKERETAAEEFLYQLCTQGIESRYTAEKLRHVAEKYPGKDPKQVVKERFEYEFQILTSKRMSDYLLIVWDFIAWAKSRKIPMGPGRGSAAGSIISYLIGITDIEPLRFHLFFERFINPERISYPDIDVDICMERRGEVIDYVIGKYGKERVAQIITFGTMKAKMAIRDVGRVLNIPLSKVNELAAMVPEDPNMTLDKALEIDPELRRLMEKDPEARRILEMAKKAEGSIRNTSTHAAGLIISGSEITDVIPVCTAKDSQMIVTQYAMKPVESVGMLKIDFLGLKTLTSIQKCVDAMAKNGGPRIDWGNLPLDDGPTFDLLNHGKTLGVFQLESGGMVDLAKQLHIDRFEEVIAAVALFRPGPMDMIPSFINRKHGREAIEIDHPLMKEVLAETYGVMVYQEQVMQIASLLAGYSLGEGDVLRRAMGKKDKEEMARQRKKFLQGAVKQGIAEEQARGIFDKIEKFASYGFNKSHAAAYGYISYVTAYLKAHAPQEWMAALMTCDQDDTSKVAKFIAEAGSLGIAVLPPDVNQAGSEFVATSEGIRFAMTGIKGVGSGVVDAIIREREARGPFQSFYEFIQRIDKAKVGKKQIELLIEAGCFDFTGWSRDQMALSLEEMFESAQKDQQEEAIGVLNFLSLLEEPSKKLFTEAPHVPTPSSRETVLQKEKERLGLYLTGHPMDSYKKVLGALSCVPFKEFERAPDGALFRTAFIVDAIQTKISSKTQKKFAILTISDGIERLELPIWPEMFEEKGKLLRENQLLYAIVQVERRGGVLQLSCHHLEDLTVIDEARLCTCEAIYHQLSAQSSKAFLSKGKRGRNDQQPSPSSSFGGGMKGNGVPLVTLKVDADRIRLSEIYALKQLFREFPGKSPINLQFLRGSQRIATVVIDAAWGVRAEEPFFSRLRALNFPVDPA